VDKQPEHLVSEMLKLPPKKIPVSQERWDYFVAKYGAEKTAAMCELRVEKTDGE